MVVPVTADVRRAGVATDRKQIDSGQPTERTNEGDAKRSLVYGLKLSGRAIQYWSL